MMDRNLPCFFSIFSPRFGKTLYQIWLHGLVVLQANVAFRLAVFFWFHVIVSYVGGKPQHGPRVEICFCKAPLISDGPPLSSATSLQHNTLRFQQHLHTLEVVFLETDGFSRCRLRKKVSVRPARNLLKLCAGSDGQCTLCGPGRIGETLWTAKIQQHYQDGWIAELITWFQSIYIKGFDIPFLILQATSFIPKSFFSFFLVCLICLLLFWTLQLKLTTE